MTAPDERCPTCDSGKRFHRGFPEGGDPDFRCDDPWHDPTPAPDERDATIALLRSDLERALALIEITEAALQAKLPRRKPEFEEWLANAKRTLTTTEPAARAFVEWVEKPWREALWGVRTYELNIDGSPCYCHSYPDDGLHLPSCKAARSLLNTAANTERTDE